MTIQINIGDHVSTEVGYISFPMKYLPDMRWARKKARAIAARIPSADVYFRALPDGKSLTTLLQDNSIWINYHPTMPHFGETNQVSGKEIAISIGACRIGRWTMLATLIHELAHVNGAPGGTDRKAEEALLACGLGKKSEHRRGVDDPYTPFSPDIEG